MKNFKVKKKHLTGELADYPKHVVQAMVDEQVRQGNKADPFVFAMNLWADKNRGGFDWNISALGVYGWLNIIEKGEFHRIPKPEKPKGHIHAKSMRQYAKDAKTSATPWKLWECKYDGRSAWYGLNSQPVWKETTQYRRKSDNQVENKENPTPNEIIKAMLDNGMTVWASVSDYSYDNARKWLTRNLQNVTAYDGESNYPVRTHTAWKYAVPVDTATMTEITKMPE